MTPSMLDSLESMDVSKGVEDKPRDIFSDILGGSVNPYTTKSKMKGEFAKEVEDWKEQAISDFYDHGIDLNVTIAKIAENNNLNNEQISRIVEETNSEVFLREYDHVKTETVRDVDFNLADLQKIKDMISNDSTSNIEVSGDPEEQNEEHGDIDKRASEVKMDCFSFSPYSFGGVPKEDPERNIRSLTKIASEKIESIYNNHRVAMDKFASETMSVGKAIAEYERIGLDSKGIFNSMCKEAGLSKKYQSMIKQAAEDSLEEMKIEKKANDSVSLNLELIDAFEKEADFSLGDKSLEGKKEKKNKKEVPPVETDDKIISGYGDLINAARNVKKRHEELEEENKKKENIDKKVLK